MRTIAILLVTIIFVSPAFATQANSPKSPVAVAQLASNTLPAQGKQSTILKIGEFGRYAVSASSAQGTALQYVDRMAGPSDISGVAGDTDGRLDLFLNRGEYKIVTYAQETGSGDAQLAVHPFKELNPKTLPQLIKYKLVEQQLDDFQQRSYWLHLQKRETIVIEAAGRNLADLRLWKDGNWLLEESPILTQVYPHPDKPLQVAQLNIKLDPGLYLLTAYGGPSQSWTTESDEHPLYIRYGIPRLPEAGQRQYQVSVFGTDRFLVPGNSNYFHLSVPEATAISMAADNYSDTNVFSARAYSVEITKKSVPPVAELELGVQSQDRIVTVSALAGQSYVLQHFETRWQYSFSRSGRFWLSTIHSGAAIDSVDATSILTRRHRFEKERLMQSRVVTIDKQQSYQRTFNLLDTLTLFLEIPQTGDYVVSTKGEGAKAKIRVEPFLTYRPEDYQAPPFESSGYKWQLDSGFYVLTLEPELKGVVTVNIEKQGFKHLRQNSMPSVSGATRYGVVSLDSNSNYRLFVNQQPGVKAGIVLRPAPVDLSMPLAVMQRGNESIGIPIKISAAGSVRAITTTGIALDLAVEKNQWQRQLHLQPGDYELMIRNHSNATVNYSLEFEAAELKKTTPLPPIAAQQLQAIPNLPTLSDDVPEYFDLDREQSATYLVKVNKPALYRLETSGLLETQGNLRTRTNPSLVRQQANGVGRNFLIQQYLREGDYQLTVKPRYQTRGHLGLSLARAAIENGGLLTTDEAARATLKAGAGLLYRFNIPSKGRYRLRAIGVGRNYVMRVEDVDGWPIVRPNIDADLTHVFEPGEYRIIIRPEAVDTRVVTTLEEIVEPIKYEGHGPHRIELQQKVEHLWLEPNEGDVRADDVWQFELPAAADTKIVLSDNMRGELALVGNNGSKAVGTILARKPWQSRLSAGTYQLSVNNVRKNNRVVYSLEVSSNELLVGQRREISIPATIPIAVGDSGFVELSSYGKADVRARLFDVNNNLVARSDDRSNDWNFLLAQNLTSGTYRMQIEAVSDRAQAGQSTIVSMHAPETQLEQGLIVPAKTTITDTHAHVYPLQLPDTNSLLALQATSDDVVGLSIEVGQQQSWKVLGTDMGNSATLLLPVEPSGSLSYRVRVWSVDRRGEKISLYTQAIEPGHISEWRAKTFGASLKTIKGLAEDGLPRIAVAAIDVDHPGIFNIDDMHNVIWSTHSEQVLQKTHDEVVKATGSTIWVAKIIDDKAESKKLHLQRIELNENNKNHIRFIVPPHGLSHVDIKNEDGLLLAIAEARVGQAGVNLQAKGSGEQKPYSMQRIGIAQQSAVSIGVSLDDPVATVWNAGERGTSLEVDLHYQTIKKVSKLSASAGDIQQTLAVFSAIEVTLAEGNKRFNLVFPPNMAAAIVRNNEIISTHWSGRNMLNEVTHADADKIIVINASDRAKQFRLAINPMTEKVGTIDGFVGPVLATDKLFQQHLANKGTIRLPVKFSASGESAVVRVRGAADVMYVQQDGQIRRGQDISIQAGGELVIKHQPGLVLAWLDGFKLNQPTTQAKVQTLDIEKPQALALHAKQQHFQIDAKQGVQLLLRADTPLISRVTRPNVQDIVEAHPQGVNYTLYIPKGRSTISVHAIGPAAMSGALYVSSVDIVSIQEGYGPESILSGGSSKLYAFTISQAGPIGLGVQASNDAITSVLMDEAGKIVSEGVVHMPVLSPGKYVFAVSVPQNSMPVRLRPVLVGFQRPGSGPPEEVIKKYLKQSGFKLEQ
ncbi:hypothetical protein [Kaarinaea lacus]